jgi:hypothetical protein
MEQVMSELKKRLRRASGDRLTPQVHYTSITPPVGGSSPHEDAWTQPLLLLHSAAVYTRKSLADPFFFRGLHVNHRQLRVAMDVCSDSILKDTPPGDAYRQASRELVLLEAIMVGEDRTSREACAYVRQVMTGAFWREYDKRTPKIESLVEDLRLHGVGSIQKFTQPEVNVPVAADLVLSLGNTNQVCVFWDTGEELAFPCEPRLRSSLIDYGYGVLELSPGMSLPAATAAVLQALKMSSIV